MKELIPVERIENKTLLIRGQKIMLAHDLAELYGVPTRRLNEQVKRNIGKFPKDFMFQLTNEELEDLRSQFATAKLSKARTNPYAFTEHGALMSAHVLNSPKAVEVSVQVTRAFVRLRQILASHEEIRRKIDEHDKKISVLFDAVRQLMAPPPVPTKRKIGFPP